CGSPATPTSPARYATTAVIHTGRSIYFMPPDMGLCDFAGPLTGVAVAGFRVHGDGVPEDAHVTGLTLDKTDARRGWITIAGQDRLYEFVIDVT
uniref:hypothetical protein n=1 Tax=Prescottella subtropica TaxID=2545757 RepID=UPI0013867055